MRWNREKSGSVFGWKENIQFCLLRLRGHLCVQESSIKGKEPEEKENPKTQNYLLRQIQSRKGNIWLARRRTVGGVGAVHGWSGGEQPALCLRTEWCTPWGHCRRPNITDTSTHTFSLSRTHACLHTHTHTHTHTHIHMFAGTCMHTHTKTITFLCFYECFINHVNGSQSYTP